MPMIFQSSAYIMLKEQYEQQSSYSYERRHDNKRFAVIQYEKITICVLHNHNFYDILFMSAKIS